MITTKGTKGTKRQIVRLIRGRRAGARGRPGVFGQRVIAFSSRCPQAEEESIVGGSGWSRGFGQRFVVFPSLTPDRSRFWEETCGRGDAKALGALAYRSCPPCARVVGHVGNVPHHEGGDEEWFPPISPCPRAGDGREKPRHLYLCTHIMPDGPQRVNGQNGHPPRDGNGSATCATTAHASPGRQGVACTDSRGATRTAKTEVVFPTGPTPSTT